MRLSDLFDLYSTPSVGTVLYARFVPRGQFESQDGSASRQPDGLEIGDVCLPMRDEIVCGDAWATRRGWSYRPDDGWPTGWAMGPMPPRPLEARSQSSRPVVTGRPRLFVSEIHGALRSTRGAAVADRVPRPRARRDSLRGCGQHRRDDVHAGATRSMVSLNGTVGHEMRKIQEFALRMAGGRARRHAIGRTCDSLAASTNTRARRPVARASSRRGSLPRLQW